MAGTGTQALASEFTTAQNNVKSALSKVSRSWTWSNSVSSGTIMNASAMEELKNALDYAGAGIVTSSSRCTTHYNSNYANNSHTVSCDANNTGYRSNYSGCYMHRSSG